MHSITRNLVLAGVAGASLFGGVAVMATTSGAQEPTESTAPADDTATDPAATDPGAPLTVEGEGDCQPGGRHGRGPNLEVAADAIGIEVDALHEALEGGDTLAQVAEANGVDPQAVIDALVADVQTHLDEEVASGELTQDEADERFAEASERIADGVENGRPDHGERPERPADAPADAPAEAPEGS